MRLRRALAEFVIDGIETTIPLFQRLVNEPDIVNGALQHPLARELPAKSRRSRAGREARCSRHTANGPWDREASPPKSRLIRF